MSDPTSTALSHLTSMSNLHPDLASQYSALSDLYSKKLWHQFTVSSLSFLSDPSTLRPDNDGTNSHLAFFQQVVLPIDSKLNPLCLARMASLVAFGLPDGTDTVLQPLLQSKAKLLGPAAALYLTSRLGLLHLTLLAKSSSDLSSPTAIQTLEQVATYIESNRSNLEEIANTESEAAIVHSAYYEMAMTYRKAVGPPEKYYNEAIQYVAYTNLSELSEATRHGLAVDLSLSALTGEGVFNFGEIIASPVLQALRGSQEEYLVKLLECGSHGDVLGFASIAEAHSQQIALQPSLVSRSEAVKEKITLLALVNMVFERPSLERTLAFEDVASRVNVTIDQVEWVIMRALSLNLIKGTMDQCEQSVDVTWVMPRVLNEVQMGELAGRFGEWAVKVSKTRDYMLQHTGALLNQ